MKRKHWLAMALSVCLFVFFLTGNVGAVEYNSMKPGRWHIIHNGLATTVVDDTLLDISSGLKGYITDGCSPYASSPARVFSRQVSKANLDDAKVFYITPTPARWEALDGSDDTYAITEKDTREGFTFSKSSDYNDYSPLSYKNYVYFVRARVYINPNKSTATLSAAKKQGLLVHELGHVYGLGHPGSSTQSVMVTGPSSLKYTTLQPYDNQDLQRMYIPEVLS